MVILCDLLRRTMVAIILRLRRGAQKNPDASGCQALATHTKAACAAYYPI